MSWKNKRADPGLRVSAMTAWTGYRYRDGNLNLGVAKSAPFARIRLRLWPAGATIPSAQAGQWRGQLPTAPLEQALPLCFF